MFRECHHSSIRLSGQLAVRPAGGGRVGCGRRTGGRGDGGRATARFSSATAPAQATATQDSSPQVKRKFVLKRKVQAASSAAAATAAVAATPASSSTVQLPESPPKVKDPQEHLDQLFNYLGAHPLPQTSHSSEGGGGLPPLHTSAHFLSA